jgi:thiosulfate dehydrogenase [quinone] large subunit
MSSQRLDVSSMRQPRWVSAMFDDTKTVWPWAWLALRVWLGYQWFEAGWEKLTNPAWVSTGEALKSFWLRSVAIPAPPGRPAITYDWYRGFLQFLLDNGTYPWFARLITYGEILVAIGLILGATVGFAAFVGALMNFNFMLAGSASTNPVMFLAAVVLIVAWKVAGYYGLDRWILPALGTPWSIGWLFGGGRIAPSRTVVTH